MQIHTKEQNLHSLRICFYGAGSMAEAIVRGILQKELMTPEQISVLNHSNEQRLTELHSRYGVTSRLQGKTPKQLIREADLVVLAMKPKDAVGAISSLSSLLQPNQLVVSVIAGLSIASIQSLLPKEQPVVRTMPNTSSTIGLGITGISFSSQVELDKQQIVESIFAATGMTIVIDEALQDAITGISGSGPAYAYYFMEGLTEAAIKLGLPAESAGKLAIQTVLGAATMASTSPLSPTELRRKVTSPGGTTEAGIAKLEELGVYKAIESAASRAAQKAGELGAAMEASINSNQTN